jgi:hypothetical protein
MPKEITVSKDSLPPDPTSTQIQGRPPRTSAITATRDEARTQISEATPDFQKSLNK